MNSQKNNKKSICVIGAGHWGKNHVKTLHSLGVNIGVVEKEKKIREELSSMYHNCKIYKNINEALEFGYDGFTIATPAAMHFDNAKKIIESKNHVLVEKPITMNKDQAIELNNLAKTNHVNLMVGHLLLFHPAFNKIKNILDEGKLGDLQYIYSNRLNHGVIRSDENVFWSLAPHDISLFQFFFNNIPFEIISSGVDILQNGIHDTTITSLKYPGNKMGHIFVSWLHPFKEHRFIIIGSKGMVHFEDSLESKPLLFYNKNVDFKNNIPVANQGDSKIINYKFEYPLTLELKYFIDHLDGKKVKIASGESAIEVMEILERATKSLEGESLYG